MSYAYYLNAILTARLPAPTMKRLKKRARELGVTPSELVRTRGAEKLLGHGDLYADIGRGIVRAQGALP